MRPTLEQWKNWQGRYSKLPYYDTFQSDELFFPSSWDSFYQEASDRYVILESGKDGRYTYVAMRPTEWLRVKNDEAVIESDDGKKTTWSSRPLHALREWLKHDHIPTRPSDAPPMLGGAIGWISYDLVRSIERIPSQAIDDLGFPELIMYRCDQLWVWDHQDHRLICSVHVDNINKENFQENINPTQPIDDKYLEVQQIVNQMVQQWRRWATGTPEIQARSNERKRSVQMWQGQPEWDILVDDWTHLQRTFSSEAFRDAVLRIQEYIRSGDVFQVNLSVRQSCELNCPPTNVYEWLRTWNPSPYMGLFHAPDHQLVSGSPELLVKTRGQKVYTRPIAGTRPRGKTPEEDLSMEQQLLANEKEIAEHIMLVDLERNDLGRVCSFGSVRVSELLSVERYSHVMHLVSQVEGQLADHMNGIDLLAATFPGGTITGAPKIRTMEIIEELEHVRRGPYTGSMGWIDYGGDLEMNILIRTLVHHQGMAYIQAGAGIVIDSIPEKEYQESLNKAKALWKALMCAIREQEDTDHTEGVHT